MEGIRVGLVGSGFIAKQKHLPAWKKAGNGAQVVALCDPQVALAEDLAREHGIPKVYTDFQQMLEAERLDAVDICSPPRTHADLAIRALGAQAHVLIEKPMAINTQECDRIVAASKENGRKICVAHSDLFYQSFLKARALVKQGIIGEFRGMRIFLSTPTDYITSKPDHWAHGLPGGIIGETGPHVIYMTLAFINPIVSVRVEARKQLKQFPWSPFEDYRLDLMGENASCSVALTYATNRWAVQVDVWGSRGHMKFDLETQTLIVHGRPNLKPLTLGLSTVNEAGQLLGGGLGTSLSYITGKFQNTHETLVKKFVESIRNGCPTPVPPEEGREAVRVMELLVNQLPATTT